MDSNFRNKLLASNLFQSIFQEVDDFMHKDTVKYVEKVESVGLSIKKLYSNIVEDMLPYSAGNVKSGAEEVNGKSVNMSDHVKSATCITEEPTCVSNEQFSVEQVSIDTSRNSNASLTNVIDHVAQLTEDGNADHSQDANTCLHRIDDGNAIIWNDAVHSIEENTTGDEIHLTANSSSNCKMLYATSDKDNKNSMCQTMASSTALSAAKAGILALKEGSVSGNDFSNEAECFPSIPSHDCLSNDKLSLVESTISYEDVHLSEPPATTFTDEVDKDNGLLTHSPLCASFSTKEESLDVSSPSNSPEPLLYCHNEADSFPSIPSSDCFPTSGSNEQFYAERVCIDTSRNLYTSLTIELDHVLQLTEADHSQEGNTCLHRIDDGDTIIWDDAVHSIEENSTGDEIHETANSSSNCKMLYATSDEDKKNSMLTMASSAALSDPGAGISAVKEGSISVNNFSDEGECSPGIPSNNCLSNAKLLLVENTISYENVSLSELPATTFTEQFDEDDGLLTHSPLCVSFSTKEQILDMSSPSKAAEPMSYCHKEAECSPNIPSTDCLSEDKLPQVENPISNDNLSISEPPATTFNDKVGDNHLSAYSPLCVSFPMKDESLGLSRPSKAPKPLLYCHEEERGFGIVTSSCSASSYSNILEFASEKFTQKDENICNLHAEPNCCAYNASTQPCKSAAFETKTVNAVPALSILKPNGGTHEFGVDMETVDLSTNMKHDGRSTLLTGNFVYAASASHRRRNFRYYKKLIQDAFASKKRLSKEYEHLAILYGDIDMELGQHFVPSSVPSFPDASSQAVRTQSFQNMYEADWELL